MRPVTTARGSFLLRLRVRSDGAWTGQVEEIRSGCKVTFDGREELLERLAAMLAGSACDAAASEEAAP